MLLVEVRDPLERIPWGLLDVWEGGGRLVGFLAGNLVSEGEEVAVDAAWDNPPGRLEAVDRGAMVFCGWVDREVCGWL